MRLLAFVLVFLGTVQTACIEEGSYRIEVINKSSGEVCRYAYSDCVDPKSKGVFQGECDTSNSWVTITITANRTENIYEKTALCHQWDAAVLVVDERAGQTVATDSILDPSLTD